MSYNGIPVVGTSLHVHPKPDRIIGSKLRGWTRVGRPNDFEYEYYYGPNLGGRQRWNGDHLDCKNLGCNRRDLRRFHNQHEVDWRRVAGGKVKVGFI